ncbi:MAG: DUF2948 family protein [Alphaproteobacteria bacterium]|nr:DUF2948 family protein [Alphaproteobacteria bacterium]
MSGADGALRLKAEDAEDFRILAACLQDALVPVGDMNFDAGSREFVLLANRYRWEGDERTAERIHCAVHFTGVGAVRRRGFDLRERARVLDLLTIEIAADAVTLLFAEDAAIRLEGSSIGGRLRDVGAPWPGAATPRHPAA